MTECIFYGGKGGVGKTTCGAVTGLGLARDGQETLVVSIDPAHSLSDALETDLGPEPAAIEPSLSALEIDPDERVERFERVATDLASDLRSVGIAIDDEEVERIFASGAPAGSDELAALDVLADLVAADEWETIVFDTAPTGHTLRLFDTPEVMDLALRTTRSLRDQLGRLADSARRMTLGPFAATTGDEAGDELAALRDRLERASEVLTDPVRTEFRVVLVPERMAIAESERLVGRLEAAGAPVRRIVVNRVFADADPNCSRCQARRRRHEDRIEEIRESFETYDVTTVPELNGEIEGRESLSKIVERLTESASAEG